MAPSYTTRLVLLWLLVLVSAPHAAFAQKNPTTEPVYQAFDRYKTAILTNDAETALAWVDSKTVRYYGEMLDKALHLNEAQTRSLRLIDLFTVLAVRHRIPPATAKSMNAETFFKYGVANGWVGKNSVMGLELVHVDIAGTFATTKMAAGGVESPVAFQFNKEDGQWKIDLTSILAWSNVAFKQLAEQRGFSEEEFLFLLLESVSGRKVEASVWQPIN